MKMNLFVSKAKNGNLSSCSSELGSTRRNHSGLLVVSRGWEDQGSNPEGSGYCKNPSLMHVERNIKRMWDVKRGEGWYDDDENV